MAAALAAVFIAGSGRSIDAEEGVAQATATVVCESEAAERQACAADTSRGVTLLKSLGSATCEEGRTWGFDNAGVWVSDGCSAEFALDTEQAERFGRYSPTDGFTVADTPYGQLKIRIFGYLRYLNQLATDSTYTDAFGRTFEILQRQDFQLNKVQVYFFGWLLSEKFRYSLYAWTSNASQGQVSQVQIAGTLEYTFNEHFTFGGGISGLPGVRSMEGNFPYWLFIDERQIADEYFRPSYTTGIYARGEVVDRLRYAVMLGNNLSQFGVDAGQLDNKLSTLSAGLIWMPTTGEFGRGFGDFEEHDTLAVRLGAHVTVSDETRQGQPDTDAFDNVQIRVSDGSVIFTPELFAPGTQINEVVYRMFAVDAGIKYKGYSFDVEAYRRRLNNFTVLGPGVLPFDALRDTGIQVQASTMAVPKWLQVYAGGSRIFGEYGNPSDVRAGVTFFPWRNEAVRWNFEFIAVDRSPVGALTLPYSVGSNGPIFHSTFMVWF